MNQELLAPARWVACWGRWMQHLHHIARKTPRQVARVSGHHQPIFPLSQSALALRAVATAPAATVQTTHRATRSPLRVIRMIEVGQASALAGRILMSGRMADVCAELDRMVERETAMQPGA